MGGVTAGQPVLGRQQVNEFSDRFSVTGRLPPRPPRIRPDHRLFVASQQPDCPYRSPPLHSHSAQGHRRCPTHISIPVGAGGCHQGNRNGCRRTADSAQGGDRLPADVVIDIVNNRHQFRHGRRPDLHQSIRGRTHLPLVVNARGGNQTGHDFPNRFGLGRQRDVGHGATHRHAQQGQPGKSSDPHQEHPPEWKRRGCHFSQSSR